MLIRSPSSTSQRGVTLIEVMVVVTILAIVIMLGLPSIQNWLKNARIRTTAEEMVAGLQLARSEAVRRNCNVEFVVSGAGGGWAAQVTDRCADGASVVQERPPTAAVGDVVVTPVPGGAATVTFNGLGFRATNADGSDTMTAIAIDLPTTILPAAESRDLLIQIELNGQIRSCDPNVTSATDSRYCN